jgi:hypothetical protein
MSFLVSGCPYNCHIDFQKIISLIRANILSIAIICAFKILDFASFWSAKFILRLFGVQNLFCVFLECKIYFAFFWSAKFILRGLDKTQFMTMLSITRANTQVRPYGCIVELWNMSCLFISRIDTHKCLVYLYPKVLALNGQVFQLFEYHKLHLIVIFSKLP